MPGGGPTDPCGGPVINTVLFGLYHFFSPWRYPAIIFGFLPITWMAWRNRSVYVSIAAHVAINMITVVDAPRRSTRGRRLS